MTRAVYTFTDPQSKQIAEVIEFDLVDNPGVRAWQCAVMLNDKSRKVQRKSVGSLKQAPVPLAVYSDLKYTLEQLASTKYAVDIDLPESADLLTQDLMNVIHRHFTNSCQDLWDPKNISHDQSKINQWLQDLNYLIHELECYLPTPHKLKYAHLGNEIHAVPEGSEFSYDIFPFRSYHSYEPADLILDGHILGKTLMESFMCHDSPTSWDTSGHVRTSGGAVMLLSQHRSQIYQSDKFRAWLEQHNTNQHARYADFPLGNLVPGHGGRMEALKSQVHRYFCEVSIQL